MKKDFQSKIITVEQALALVKSDDYIVTGLAQSEARVFQQNLHKIAHRVKNVRVSTCLNILDYEYIKNAAYKEAFIHESWFYTPSLRAAHANGNVSFIPNHLHLGSRNRLTYRKPNIFTAVVSYPDEHGYMSLLSAVYEMDMLEASDIVILEINKKYPRTFGENQIHVDDVDYLIEVDYEVPEVPDAEPSENDLKIASYIVPEIEDGSSIQLGIGGTPSAVAAGLIHKKDLGIHTEMFTTSMAKLIKAGAITGKKKNVNTGLHVCAFAFGTKELYAFLDNNPSVRINRGGKTVNPTYIALNDKQISINSTLTVDLTGQCASESLGSIHFSGTGGQADTARGAVESNGGKSFIVFHSTASVKDKVTGERKLASKIVAQLPLGSAVSLQRTDADRIVTEYGIAYMQGRTIAERCEQLIQIAHPSFREELKSQAIALGLLPKQ